MDEASIKTVTCCIDGVLKFNLKFNRIVGNSNVNVRKLLSRFVRADSCRFILLTVDVLALKYNLRLLLPLNCFKL
jgi:hypothetical protein